MNAERLKQDIKQLASEYPDGAELLGCNLLSFYVQKAGIDDLQAERDITAIQDAANLFRVDMLDRCTTTPGNYQIKLSRYIHHIIRCKLSPYSPDERRGILLKCIEQMHSWSVAAWESSDIHPQQLLKLSRTSESKLERVLAQETQKLAIQIIETEARRAQKNNSENNLVREETGTTSAMAIACAGYLNIPMLRPYPETLGTVAEAACALGEDTQFGRTLREAAITLLAMSALIAVEVTTMCMTGMIAGNIGCLLLGESLAWASVSEVVHECFDFFCIALAVHTGISSAGLLAGCAAELAMGADMQLIENETIPVGDLEEILENEMEEDGEEESY